MGSKLEFIQIGFWLSLGIISIVVWMQDNNKNDNNDEDESK